MQLEEKFRIRVDSVNLRGAGIGRIDGMVVFVPGLLADEEALISITAVEKNYAIGKIEKILSPSPDRVASDCPFYGTCGGCTFRHATYREEALIKQRAVKDALRRNGIHKDVNLTITASPERPRNKAILHFTPDGKIGLFEKGSHTVCPVNDCLLLPSLFSSIARFTENFFSKTGIKPIYLYLRISTERTVTVVLSVDAFKENLSLMQTWQKDLCQEFATVSGVLLTEGSEPESSTKPFYTLFGTPFLTDQIGGINLRSSCYSFRQVNFSALELLLEEIRHCADLHENDRVADLYCGTGALGQVVASLAPGAKITGVEINKEAVKDAEYNASANGLKNIRYFCGDSAKYVKNAGAVDCALIDPPRSGCTPSMLKELLLLNPKTIVYVSCNPDSLAQNLKKLTEKYEIVSVTPVDLFPRTSNVETVVLLSRRVNVHNMKLHASPFEMIKKGQKTIELRLFDEKRQQIKAGDKIVFTNTTTGETLNTTVVNLHRFNNFKELYHSLPLLQCGYTTEDVAEARPSDMEQYYSVEEQKNYGVVGIELCRQEEITDKCCTKPRRKK